MPHAARPPMPPAERLELMVSCLQALEREGAAGVAALLAAHPDEAPGLLHRLMILGELGLLPEAGADPDPS